MESFLASRGSVKSKKSYETTLKALFQDRTRSPASYTRREIEAFVSRPTARGNAVLPNGFNMRLTYIQSFYKYASIYPIGSSVLMKRILPTTGIKRRNPAEQLRTFEQDEIVRFFNAIPRQRPTDLRNYAIFLTLFLTARRESEIRLLRWCDISREGAIIYYKWTGKNMYGSYKKAELPIEAYEAIESYLRVDDRLGFMRPEDYIFKAQGQLQNKPACWSAIGTPMKSYLSAAGIRAGSMHWLRHTSAYFRSLDGAELHELMLLLGHKSPATTLIYLEAWKRPKRDQRASRLAQMVLK